MVESVVNPHDLMYVCTHLRTSVDIAVVSRQNQCHYRPAILTFHKTEVVVVLKSWAGCYVESRKKVAASMWFLIPVGHSQTVRRLLL